LIFNGITQKNITEKKPDNPLFLTIYVDLEECVLILLKFIKKKRLGH